MDLELRNVSEATGFYMKFILLGSYQELHKYLLNEKKNSKKRTCLRTKSMSISSSKAWTKRKKKNRS